MYIYIVFRHCSCLHAFLGLRWAYKSEHEAHSTCLVINPSKAIPPAPNRLAEMEAVAAALRRRASEEMWVVVLAELPLVAAASPPIDSAFEALLPFLACSPAPSSEKARAQLLGNAEGHLWELAVVIELMLDIDVPAADTPGEAARRMDAAGQP